MSDPERPGWAGWRRLVVADKRKESRGVSTLELADPTGAPLPPYRAGQYLTLRVQPPDAATPLVRCYSLSDAPGEAGGRYPVTVKRLGAPPAHASGFLVDALRPGEALEARAAQGRFTVERGGRDPLVLLAGGVGITPLRAIVRDLAARGDPREAYLFFGVRHGGEHPFGEDLARLAAAHPPLRLVVAYSRPRAEDRLGERYHHAGRVTVALLEQTLPKSDRPYRFYVCGPPAMTAALVEGLEGLGVPPSRVRLEAFGPATVRPLTRRLTRRLGREPGRERAPAAAGRAGRVRFARSGVTARWEPGARTLLELGMAHDVWIPFACAAGRCGTCATGLLEGAVAYPVEPEFPLRPGRCLPCVAVPAGDVTLDA